MRFPPTAAKDVPSSSAPPPQPLALRRVGRVIGLSTLRPPARARAGLLVVAAIGVLALAPAAPVEARPNVVFIMTDDQTASSIEVQRNVGLLRTQGTTFTQAVASYPLCCPSRATYLSGQYSHNNGVLHNAGPFGGYLRFGNSNALPVWLEQAGYRTIHVGRYLNGYGTMNPDITEIPPGWTDWISTVDPTTFSFNRWRMNENGAILEKPDIGHPGEFQTDYLGRRAAEMIETAAPSDQPFFLSLTFPAPHTGGPRDPDDPPDMITTSPAPRHRDAFAGRPLPRPPNFNEADVSDKPQIVADRPLLTEQKILSIQENYQQELEALLSVDDAVGSVISALERTGELENTLVIYTSDNGYFHGEHRRPAEKILPYEPSIRVPLVVRGPGVPQGRNLGQLVGNIDFSPTIVDAADAVPGRLMDGRSLFELFDDPRRETGREIVLENGFGANGIPAYRGLRSDRYVWVEHLTTGEYELYDLQKDPYELRNLEDRVAYEDVRLQLAKRLRKLKRCKGTKACSASRPALKLRVRQTAAPAPRGRRGRALSPQRPCAARGVRLSLTGKEVGVARHVRYLQGERRLQAARRPPFAVTVSRRRLPKGRKAALHVRVTMDDGRRATYDRSVTLCKR